MVVSEYSATALFEPMRFIDVKQGEYAAAKFTAETTHLATFGLFLCKAVSIYNPDTQFGVLAHIDGTTHPDRITRTIVDAYGDNVSEAEVTVARTTESDLTIMWPSLDDFVELFKHHSPRSLRVDTNLHMREPRGFALCLESGHLYEVDSKDAMVQQSFPLHRPSKPLRDQDALWI